MGENKPILKSTLDIEDKVVREHIESLQANGQRILVGLEAAPTADEPLLDDTESGIYSGSLYIRDGATIHVITIDSTITIT